MITFIKCKCISKIDNDDRISVGNEYWVDTSSYVLIPSKISSKSDKFFSLYSEPDILACIGCFNEKHIELLEEEVIYENKNG